MRSGFYAVARLSASAGHSEASHDLVEDQDCAIFTGDVAQAFKKPGNRRNTSHIASDRLDDDTGYFARIFVEYGLHGSDVVERRIQRISGDGFRDTRRIWNAQGQYAAAGFDQQGIGMAVVAAGKLQNLVASGKPSGQTDGGHGGLGAGIDHAHFRHARHHLDDLLSQVDFTLCGCAESQRLLRLG